MVEYDQNVIINAPYTLTTGGDMTVNANIDCREDMQEMTKQAFFNAIDSHEGFERNNYIRFYNVNLYNDVNKSARLNAVLVDGDPYLVYENGLAIEKDIVAKGMYDSLEGEIALNAGTKSPGWGPYTRNPFVWLAQAQKNAQNNDIYSQLEIRKIVGTGLGESAVESDEFSHMKWGWGDLACGALNLHSKKLTSTPTFDDAALIFWDDSVKKMSLSYDTTYDILYLWDHLYNGGQGRTILSITHNGSLGIAGDFQLTGCLTTGSELRIPTSAPGTLHNGDLWLA